MSLGMQSFLICLFLVLQPLTAHADTYQKNLKSWADFVAQNKWGNSEDYWLEKNTAYGWEKVILVMGYSSDSEGCEDIKATLQAKYPLAEYRCIKANKK